MSQGSVLRTITPVPINLSALGRSLNTLGLAKIGDKEREVLVLGGGDGKEQLGEGSTCCNKSFWHLPKLQTCEKY